MTANGRSQRRPLVGRQRELAELSAAMDAASGGRGSAWLVCGEPGIGKSRLLEAAEATAIESGVRVFWGRCWEAGGAPAYWPWIQVLRPLLAGDPPAAVPATAVAQLTELLPEIGGAFDDGAAPPLGPEQARFALMDGVTEVLRAAASTAPLLMLLEDLHAADPASVTLLDFISRQVRPLPMVVVGSYREAEAARRGVGRELAALAARVRTLRLARLEADDVAACIRSVTRSEPGPRTVAAIHEATEGNPLFVVEIATLMAARGELDGTVDRVDVAVPDSVSAVIWERSATLAETTRSMLQAASVVGREFGRRELEILVEAPDATLDLALDEASAAGILERTDAGRWRFAHILTREVFHAALGPEQRRELHLRLAEALEDRRQQREHRLPWSEIAHHLLEAGPSAAARALEACVRAADQARAQLAYDDAAELYARALAILEQMGDEPEQRRCELMVERARSLLDGGRIAGGRELCVEAASAARALEDGELLARTALIYGSVFSIAEIDPVLVGLLREALQALGEGDSPDRARLQARLAAALQPADDPEEPMALAREAIAMARRSGDRRALLEAIRSGCSALMDLAEPEERLRFNREHVALAEALGEPIEALRGHMRVAIDCLDLGDLAGCDSAIAAYGAVASQIGLPHHLWPAASLRAMRAMLSGRFEVAERAIEEAQRHAARAQDPNARRTIILQRIGLARARENRDELERLQAAAVAELSGTGFADTFLQVLAGSLQARFGDSGVDGLVAPWVDAALAFHDRSLLCVVAEMASASSLRESAERLLEAIREFSGQWMTWGLFGMVCEGPVARYQALLASSLDRGEEAESHFRDAFETVRQAGARPLAARLGYEWARHLLERDRSSSEAAALLDEAYRTASDLVQVTLVEQIEELRSAAGGHVVGQAMVPTMPSFSLARDGDFWLCRCGDESFRLKDTKGVRLLARLVAEPGREMHVLDLSGAAPPDGARDAGDAGEVLDATAREQYRRRVQDLEAELAEAESFNDRGRAEKAREELDAIATELSRAFGLGGRERRSGTAAERARVNVQRRLRDAVRRIEQHCPEAGRHLEWALTTGMYCVYDPRVT